MVISSSACIPSRSSSKLENLMLSRSSTTISTLRKCRMSQIVLKSSSSSFIIIPAFITFIYFRNGILASISAVSSKFFGVMTNLPFKLVIGLPTKASLGSLSKMKKQLSLLLDCLPVALVEVVGVRLGGWPFSTGFLFQFWLLFCWLLARSQLLELWLQLLLQLFWWPQLQLLVWWLYLLALLSQMGLPLSAALHGPGWLMQACELSGPSSRLRYISSTFCPILLTKTSLAVLKAKSCSRSQSSQVYSSFLCPFWIFRRMIYFPGMNQCLGVRSRMGTYSSLQSWLSTISGEMRWQITRKYLRTSSFRDSLQKLPIITLFRVSLASWIPMQMTPPLPLRKPQIVFMRMPPKNLVQGKSYFLYYCVRDSGSSMISLLQKQLLQQRKDAACSGSFTGACPLMRMVSESLLLQALGMRGSAGTNFLSSPTRSCRIYEYWSRHSCSKMLISRVSLQVAILLAMFLAFSSSLRTLLLERRSMPLSIVLTNSMKASILGFLGMEASVSEMSALSQPDLRKQARSGNYRVPMMALAMEPRRMRSASNSLKYFILPSSTRWQNRRVSIIMGNWKNLSSTRRTLKNLDSMGRSPMPLKNLLVVSTSSRNDFSLYYFLLTIASTSLYSIYYQSHNRTHLSELQHFQINLYYSQYCNQLSPISICFARTHLPLHPTSLLNQLISSKS